MVRSMQPAGNSRGADSPAAGQLLQELQALSQALYRTGSVQAQSLHRQQTGKTALPASRANERLSSFPGSKKSAAKPRAKEGGGGAKDAGEKKGSSLWDWKPLRALAHIGRQRLACEFSLRVHSVEGLAANLNGVNLVTHWRRRDGGVKTRPARVYHGVAEFGETLYHKCSVYGGGGNQGMRYESKFFELSVSALGLEERELCRHKVDLSRMLPETLGGADLSAEERSGSWTTNFKLTAKEARGGVLVVTLGYKILDREVGETSSAKISRTNVRNPGNPNALDRKLVKPTSGVDAVKKSAGPMGGSSHALKLGLATPRAAADLDLDIVERMSNLSLDDACGVDSEKVEANNVASLFDFKPRLKFFPPGEGGFPGDDVERKGAEEEEDNAEFNVIEKGVEIDNVHLEQREGDRDCSNVEGEDLRVSGIEIEETSMAAEEGGGVLETRTNDSFLEQTVDSKEEETCSLDDVAGEFLSMLEQDKSPVPLSSDSDPESPRARLLKQFEREAGGDLALGLGIAKQVEEGPSQSCGPERHGTGGYRPGWESDEDDLELASIVQAAENELQKAAQTIRSKTRAKILEDAETEALMQEWGMNERAFQNSPPNSSGGFGSSISFPFEGPAELPDLAEGFGSLVRTKDGGMLRSMNPLLFCNAKNRGSLIMQVSNPVVVPAELGSNVMDILSNLASFGIEKLTVEAKKIMPLEDITGKTIQQVALDPLPSIEGSKNRQPTLQASEAEKGSHFELLQLADSRRMDATEYGSGTQSGASKSKFSRRANTYAEYVSLEDLAPQALEKIEALSIEGLKIQSDMADQDAPSTVNAMSFGEVAAFEGLGAKKKNSLGLEGTACLQLLDTKESCTDSSGGILGMAISLDEWMKLDAGIVDEEETSERTSKILAAHHAVCSDLVVEETVKGGKGDKSRRKHSSKRWGFMGNMLTIALLVQLRDPLRNYEPVGPPMIALVQAERIVVPPKPKMGRQVSEKGNSEEVEESQPEGQKKEELSQFKITEVHVAGLKPQEENKKSGWSNSKQQQSGSRWLIASGMGKTAKPALLKSKQGAKTMPPSKVKVKPGDTLWSISARVTGDGGRWKEVAALNPHIRNPDVIFPNETIKFR
uniref:TSA: Wollemia nobilis Ref_Wollemi_Transcript_12897_4606 transcribed RNA sequence n=1 Tax=Wollemia nobilis TaxID=56998 RepID=A0A0C9QRD3_9CONI